jgi:hypothetical protein
VNSGGPAAGVTVMLAGPDNLRREAATDDQGEYVFAGLLAGEYVLTFRGYSNHPRMAPPIQRSVVRLGDANPTVRLDIAMTVRAYRHNPNNVPMPYGAPPARRRVV